MAITLDGTNGITSSGDLTLNNGNADGAQVKLSSSGYSDWNLDNYSGRFRAYYNATEYFTITNTGNVGIGTSSPNTRLYVAANAVTSSRFTNFDGTYNPRIELKHNGNSGNAINSTSSSGGTASILGFQIDDVERMRIDSSGNVLVGATSQSANGEKFRVTQSAVGSQLCYFEQSSITPYGPYIQYTSVSPNNTTNNFIQCSDSTTKRFEVRSNGGIGNYSANNVNLSDERLKTDITPAKSYLDTICSIPVVTFKYKDQTDEELNLGVIAQSVDAVAPELVDHSGFGEAPEGESPYLAVYQTDLQYALMKCIQEQQELINTLTSRIEALESK